jgi:hypothetical protein
MEQLALLLPFAFAVACPLGCVAGMWMMGRAMRPNASAMVTDSAHLVVKVPAPKPIAMPAPQLALMPATEPALESAIELAPTETTPVAQPVRS